MGTARTTYYGKPENFSDDTALVEAMHAIQDEFEAHGWRRIWSRLAAILSATHMPQPATTFPA